MIGMYFLVSNNDIPLGIFQYDGDNSYTDKVIEEIVSDGLELDVTEFRLDQDFDPKKFNRFNTESINVMGMIEDFMFDEEIQIREIDCYH